MDKAKARPHGFLERLSEKQRARRVRFGRPGATSVVQEAFDLLAERLHSRYLGTTLRTSHAMWLALETARGELSARGAISAAQSQHLKDCLARDLDHFAAVIARGSLPAIEELRRTAATNGHFGALGYLLEVLDAAGVLVYRVSAAPGSTAMRRAGELTCAGRLSCAQCDGTTRSACSRVVEPCRECGGKVFSRSP